jgi:hypothetical protein
MPRNSPLKKNYFRPQMSQNQTNAQILATVKTKIQAIPYYQFNAGFIESRVPLSFPALSQFPTDHQ